MSEAEDKALALAREAAEFAKSKFGQHYLQRLAELKQGHLDLTMDPSYTDSFRAHHGSMAKAKDEEINYFATAQVFTTPNALARLRQKIGGVKTK